MLLLKQKLSVEVTDINCIKVNLEREANLKFMTHSHDAGHLCDAKRKIDQDNKISHTTQFRVYLQSSIPAVRILFVSDELKI